jgi:hypothetical protein
MGVRTVIRLNARPYEYSTLEDAGIRCIHIDVDEGDVPATGATADFLLEVSATIAAGGAVAVHCKEGLGRTGTMVAAYLMAAHGFSAREAIGWVRIVRPGSVVGGQQAFLVALDEVLNQIRAAAPAGPRRHNAGGADAGPAADALTLAALVALLRGAGNHVPERSGPDARSDGDGARSALDRLWAMASASAAGAAEGRDDDAARPERGRSRLGTRRISSASF